MGHSEKRHRRVSPILQGTALQATPEDHAIDLTVVKRCLSVEAVRSWTH